jgi:hypothetical protein
MFWTLFSSSLLKGMYEISPSSLVCYGFLVWSKHYTSIVSILLPFHYIAANWHDMETMQNSYTCCGLAVFCSWYSVDTEWKFCSAFFIGCTDVIDCMYVYEDMSVCTYSNLLFPSSTFKNEFYIL